MRRLPSESVSSSQQRCCDRGEPGPSRTLRVLVFRRSARSMWTSPLARATSCGSADPPESPSPSASPGSLSLSGGLSLCARWRVFSRSQLQPQQRGQGSERRPRPGSLASPGISCLRVPIGPSWSTGRGGRENGAELGLLSDAFYAYEEPEVMSKTGRK